MGALPVKPAPCPQLLPPLPQPATFAQWRGWRSVEANGEFGVELETGAFTEPDHQPDKAGRDGGPQSSAITRHR